MKHCYSTSPASYRSEDEVRRGEGLACVTGHTTEAGTQSCVSGPPPPSHEKHKKPFPEHLALSEAESFSPKSRDMCRGEPRMAGGWRALIPDHTGQGDKRDEGCVSPQVSASGCGPQGTFLMAEHRPTNKMIPTEHCCSATWGRSLPFQGS